MIDDSHLGKKEQDMECIGATQLAAVMMPLSVGCSAVVGLVIVREAWVVVRQTAAVERMVTWLKTALSVWTAGAKPRYAASGNQVPS